MRKSWIRQDQGPASWLAMFVWILCLAVLAVGIIIGQYLRPLPEPTTPTPIASSVASRPTTADSPVPSPPSLPSLDDLFPTAPPEVVIPTDGSFIRTLADWEKTVQLAYQIAEKHGRQIFPAYQLEKIPIILVDRENKQAIIVTPRSRTNASQFLTELPVGFSIRANISLPGGQRAYAFEIHPTAREDFLTFLVHEVCHMAQKQWPSPMVHVLGDPRPPEELLGLMLLEEKLLLNALRASTSASRREAMADLAAVRCVSLPIGSEMGKNPTEQDGTEWREGGAEYISFGYALAGRQLTEKRVIGKIEKIFAGGLSTETDVQERMRNRTYGIGAGLGLLFDREKLDWKKGFANGRTFTQILLKSFPPDEGRFDAVAKHDNLNALRAKARAIVLAGEQRKQAFLARWKSLTGPTITVEYPTLKEEKKSASVLKNLKIADGEDISEVSSAVTESSTFMLRAQNTFLRSTFHYPKQSVEFKGQPDSFVLDGQPAGKEGETSFKRGGSLKSATIDLHFTRPGVCTVKGQTITIRLE